MPRSLSTAQQRLDRTSPPMRLFEKAKSLGIWNPDRIDLTRDRREWLAFSQQERTVLLHLLSLFQAGEEAVTVDLLPLIQVIAQEGRLEEEIYLTSFLWEEAKHTDFFDRFLHQVCDADPDLRRFQGESYGQIFSHALPDALNALSQDPSPAAQMRAAVTYNIIVEGVLAETGYHAIFTALEASDRLPGLRQGIRLLQQDESRHIAYGLYLLTRLLADHPQLWQPMEATMNELLPHALGVVGELFACYQPMPFGLDEGEFAAYAAGQFAKRLQRLEQGRRSPDAGHAADADSQTDPFG